MAAEEQKTCAYITTISCDCGLNEIINLCETIDTAKQKLGNIADMINNCNYAGYCNHDIDGDENKHIEFTIEIKKIDKGILLNCCSTEISINIKVK